jgi:L-seryl-tRNA(Ser) seleniumtransferase
MIAMPRDALAARAEAIVGLLGPRVTVVELRSTVGGGSLPGETLPSVGVALQDGSATRSLAALRAGEPPVIARIEEGRVVLDLRTVDPAADQALAGALIAALERRR